ncbi:MAG: VCBS repeat-containing protein [Candidatus Hatepunaea meridiana]|nr:VCBS repeat-containing protein [Candidatus Hatepunaea meridiana]
MKFNKLIVISAFLLSFVITLTAQEWRWAADHSFLNPHFDPGTVGRIPGNGPTAFYDIDNDGIAELIVPSGESFDIIEQTGEFPDITWRVSDENCFENLNIVDDECWWISFILQDIDQDDFPEVIVYEVILPLRDYPPELRVFRNRGDFNNPDWIRDDELFYDIISDIEDSEFLIPRFCDWNSDGHADLIVVHWDGIQRYEQDDEGNWENLGLMRGLHYSDVAFHFADFNDDSVLDELSNRKQITHRYCLHQGF